MPPKKRGGRAPNPKGRYIIHSHHIEPPEEKDIMTWISFDPGEKNFDVRIEKRVYNRFGTTCSAITTEEQARHILQLDRVQLKEKSKIVRTVSYYFQDIIDTLDSYKNRLGNLDIVVIEGQMDINNAMIYLQSSLITYFLINYPDAFVVEISSKLKGKNLGAPEGLSRPQLKRWNGEMALNLAERRGDKVFIEYIRMQTEGKKASEIKTDDDTDNYSQIEACCVEFGYQLTPE